LERLPDLALELVRLNVDVIVAGSTPLARAVQQATTTIPIVAPALGDPVGDGFVASLARPGGNLTGSTFLGPGLVPKGLELLKEAVTSVPASLPSGSPVLSASPRRARCSRRPRPQALKVQLQFVGVKCPDELAGAFSTTIKEHADALIMFPSPMLYSERRRLVDLAAKHRLPSISRPRRRSVSRSRPTCLRVPTR
jgi:putative ABC transport system substrate-binding protein